MRTPPPAVIPLRGTSLHDGVATRLRTLLFEQQLAHHPPMAQMAALKAPRLLEQKECARHAG